MRIFLDIGHPAHVHYFKNLIKNLKNKGNQFLITAREKDVTHELLNNYKIPYISRGRGSNGLLGKFLYLFKANYQLYKLGKKFKPDLFISFASPYAGHVALFLRKPHISFTDTEHAKLGIISFLPFASIVLTPKVFKIDLGKKHLKFNGYMEQCYLQEKYFSPSSKILEQLELRSEEKFAIIRLVSWNASHDIGQSGISQIILEKLINEIKKYSKVFITSESELPQKLEKYKLHINPTEIHNVLYFSNLFIGEGATMASECAILGTPSIYINSLTAGTL
ncbi:MAG: hypothetical protein CMA06_01840, partial [Euryarchaeota archaeon]|nr:hypothetical protein [Euryarchaeota archaeon]